MMEEKEKWRSSEDMPGVKSEVFMNYIEKFENVEEIKKCHFIFGKIFLKINNEAGARWFYRFHIKIKNYQLNHIWEEHQQMNEDKKIEDSQKMCLEWIQKFLCIILKNIGKLKIYFIKKKFCLNIFSYFICLIKDGLFCCCFCRFHP